MDSIVFYFRCLCLLPPLLCFGGCARFESDTRPEDPVKQDMTYVSFNIGTASLETRDASVAAVNDINVYAYRNGKLEGNVYSDNLRKTGMYLESGKEYVFYALANVGQSYPPLEESELKALRNTVSGPDGLDLDAAVPMSATGTAVVDGAHCSLGIKLTAMVAKIGLKVESCEGFEVHTVRFMNIAADYCPFAASSQARAVMTEEFTGDSDEIREINSGKIIYVPVLENCQGSLFPANEDSRDKTPENLSDDRRALCTYVEVCASHNVSGQAAEDGPDHQGIAQGDEQKIPSRSGDPHGQKTGHQTRRQDHHIQFIRAIAACHKAAQTRAQSGGKLPQPTADSVHRDHLVNGVAFPLLYCKKGAASGRGLCSARVFLSTGD